jgi:hypothetical protein
MQPGDHVYTTTGSRAPQKMRLLRKLSDGPAGPQWEVEVEVDGHMTKAPIAEQALAPWPPPDAAS